MMMERARKPCVCGNRLLEMWSGFGSYTIKCPKCGTEAYGKTKNDATGNWNDLISERGGMNGNSKDSNEFNAEELHGV